MKVKIRKIKKHNSSVICDTPVHIIPKIHIDSDGIQLTNNMLQELLLTYPAFNEHINDLKNVSIHDGYVIDTIICECGIPLSIVAKSIHYGSRHDITIVADVLKRNIE